MSLTSTYEYIDIAIKLKINAKEWVILREIFCFNTDIII